MRCGLRFASSALAFASHSSHLLRLTKSHTAIAQSSKGGGPLIDTEVSVPSMRQDQFVCDWLNGSDCGINAMTAISRAGGFLALVDGGVKAAARQVMMTARGRLVRAKKLIGSHRDAGR